MKQERINEPTPNGGAYSIAYYRDDKWMLVDKEQATQVEVVEFNEDDNHVFRTYERIRVRVREHHCCILRVFGEPIQK